APRPRVAENLGVKLRVRCAFRGAAHRSGRHGSIPAQFDAVLNKLSRARLIPHDENHVGGLTANLKSNAPCAQREHRRRTPRTVTVLATYQHATTVGTTHQKGTLDLRRNDAHTHSFFEQVLRDAF